MAGLTGKQLDVLSMIGDFAGQTVKLSDNTLRLVGLAADRGLVSWNKSTGEITPLVALEDLTLNEKGEKVEAFSDWTLEDLTYMLMLMVGTWNNAHTTQFPDGRTAADILRKMAGNAGLNK